MAEEQTSGAENTPTSFDLLKNLMGEGNAERKPDPGQSNLFLSQYVAKLIEKINKRATTVSSGLFDMSDDEDAKKYGEILNTDRYTIMVNNGSWVPFEYRKGKDDVQKDSSYKIFIQYRSVDPTKLVVVLKEYLNQESTTVTLDLLKSIVMSNFDWALEHPGIKAFMGDLSTKREELALAAAKTVEASDQKHTERMNAIVNKPLLEDLPRLQRLYVALRKQLAAKIGVEETKLDLNTVAAGNELLVEALLKLSKAITEHSSKIAAELAEGGLAPDRSFEESLVKEDLGAVSDADTIPAPKDPNDLVFNEARVFSPEELVAEALAPMTPPEKPVDLAAGLMADAQVKDEPAQTGAEMEKAPADNTNKTAVVPEVQ